MDIRGTRTSSAWSTVPGNWDRLNLRMIFEVDDQLGIPVLGSYEVALPTQLINYNARNRLTSPEPGDCVHFFLDDYRFETVWTQPERSLSRLARAALSLTPDFSLYPEMPTVLQMFNIYRSRWCGAWMVAHGIAVIPTVGWSDERSWTYAFQGLEPGGTVAISTLGIIRATAPEQDRFLAGYDAMINHVRPARVIVYGKRFPKLDQHDQVDHVYYEARRWS